MAGAKIGQRCVLGQNVMVAPGVVIGDGVKIQNNVSLYTGVIVEDDVFIGPSAVFTNVLTPRSPVSRKHEFQRTMVRCGATIGANATVVCGVTIGRYAFVGAGALLTHDVPDYALVYGNPARLQGWMCECGVRLSLEESGQTGVARCRACQRQYAVSGDSIRRINAPGGDTLP
jgi:UDP-2-acetamido-3-amino-2,3-dideoxy-glucuronate N-acetyltransferase